MRAVATTLLVCGLVLVAGCGKRGSPLPPEPRGPFPPQDVEVRQIGSDILISFDLPEPRNKDKPAQQIHRAFLVKVEQAGSGQVPDADSFRRRGDQAGLLSLDAAEGRQAFVEPIGSMGGGSSPVDASIRRIRSPTLSLATTSRPATTSPKLV